MDSANGQEMLYEAPANSNPVPIYNYTRINIPISHIDRTTEQQNKKQQQQPGANNMFIQHALIDTYIIANLVAATQYEIKMTCYNLNGDLCAFSPPIYGLTLSSSSSGLRNGGSGPKSTTSMLPANDHNHHQVLSTSSSSSQSKQNEILFMILGVVLGALTLLLALFVIMCVVRHRQHRKLLAQLHNTSHKLTSSSCPTLIYEDSLRQAAAAAHAASQHAHLRHMLTQQHHLNSLNPQVVGTYASSKLIDTSNLFVPSSSSSNGPSSGTGSTSGNDSNSTNSQSMSTTTSSMTTPPALNSGK